MEITIIELEFPNKCVAEIDWEEKNGERTQAWDLRNPSIKCGKPGRKFSKAFKRCSQKEIK